MVCLQVEESNRKLGLRSSQLSVELQEATAMHNAKVIIIITIIMAAMHIAKVIIIIIIIINAKVMVLMMIMITNMMMILSLIRWQQRTRR